MTVTSRQDLVKNAAGSVEWRAISARSGWSLLFIWFVLFVWLNQTDQIDQTDEIDQTNQTAVTCCNAINELKLSVERPTTASLRSAVRLRWRRCSPRVGTVCIEGRKHDVVETLADPVRRP